MTHWLSVGDIGEPAAMTNSKDQAQSPRTNIPVLMLNGRYDAGNPPKEAQEPMFQLLGTEPARKRYKLTDSSHVASVHSIATEACFLSSHHSAASSADQLSAHAQQANASSTAAISAYR